MLTPPFRGYLVHVGSLELIASAPGLLSMQYTNLVSSLDDVVCSVIFRDDMRDLHQHRGNPG
jgi:hypothetical protein